MKTHQDLIHDLIIQKKLVSQQLIEAFEYVDRANFVTKITEPYIIYEDIPLSIGYGQTISQPSVVAFMLELLQPQKKDHILDVGSGSGWTTAILAHVVGKNGLVRGVEIVPDLVRFGQNNLRHYSFSHAIIVQAHKIYGDPNYAPYEKILVSAAGTEIPDELIAQLAIGGVLVMPVYSDVVRYVKISSSHGRTESFHGFSFVPLIPCAISS